MARKYLFRVQLSAVTGMSEDQVSKLAKEAICVNKPFSSRLVLHSDLEFEKQS